MAVAYDTHTLKGETTGDSTWSHTAAASGVRGVLVYIATVDVTTIPVGVTYGGSAMTRIATAQDTLTEPGGAFAYWLALDGSTLQGTRTVSVDVGATQVWIGMALSFTASSALSYNTGVQQENAANPSITITAPHAGFVGYPSGAYYTGVTAPLGAGSGYTEVGGVDSGNNAYAFLRYTTGTTTGNATVATAAAASDDLAFVAVLVGENVLTPGIATSTESALTATVVSPVTISCGIATETDTALAATVVQSAPAQTIACGIAAETDTALAATVVPGPVTITPSIATETDTAQASTVATSIAITCGIATETAQGLAATVASSATIQPGIATETSTALAASTATTITIQTGTATETGNEEALPVTVVAATTIGTGIATEADTALAATIDQSAGPDAPTTGGAGYAGYAITVGPSHREIVEHDDILAMLLASMGLIA